MSADLTEDEARLLTARITEQVSDLLPLIREAFERRAWIALGHLSWDAYCDTELRGLRLPVGERREAVRELVGAGMSRRSAAAALGVDDKTVRNDLRGADFSAPAEVQGTDGKTYPVHQSSTSDAEPPAEEVEPVSSQKPERPRPPKWDPEERRQHEEEVRRVQDIEAARRYSKTIVTEFRSLVVTVVTGCRYGEKGLVTADMIADLRKTLDLLEGEL